jgi:hypothetical protein
MSGFDDITFDDVLAIGKELLASIFQPDAKEGETGVASCLSALVDWIDTAVKGKCEPSEPKDSVPAAAVPALTVTEMVNRAVRALDQAHGNDPALGSYDLIQEAEQWRLLAAMCAAAGMP